MNDIVIIQPGEIVVYVVAEINHEHELSMSGMRTTLEHAIRCGELLVEQKARIPEGEWQLWFMENIKFSYRQGVNYMKVYYAKVQRAALLNEATSIRGALRIIAQADPKPKRLLPTPPAPMFTWFKEGLVQAMDAGVEAIQRSIPILAKAEQDHGVAIYILTMLRKSRQYQYCQH